MTAGTQPREDRPEPVQFTLRDLFLLTFLASLYFPVAKLFGDFAPPIALGLVVAVVVVRLAHLENVLAGACSASAIAATWYIAAALIWGLWGNGAVALGAVIYIGIAYVLGAGVAVHRELENA